MVYAQEAPGFTSLGSEIAATVMEKAFFALEAPVLRVSGFDVPFPPAKLEGTYLPDADRILEAVDGLSPTDRPSRREPRAAGAFRCGTAGDKLAPEQRTHRDRADLRPPRRR